MRITNPITIDFTFTWELEPNTNCISWSCPLYPFIIYATPYYEEQRGICVQICHYGKDPFSMIEWTFNIPWICHEEFWSETINVQDPIFAMYLDFMQKHALPLILNEFQNHCIA